MQNKQLYYLQYDSNLIGSTDNTISWTLLYHCVGEPIGSPYLKAESHDFTGQAVSPEKCLHGVGQLNFFREHVPQQLVEQVPRVKQCHQHPSQLILWGHIKSITPLC